MNYGDDQPNQISHEMYAVYKLMDCTGLARLTVEQRQVNNVKNCLMQSARPALASTVRQ